MALPGRDGPALGGQGCTPPPEPAWSSTRVLWGFGFDCSWFELELRWDRRAVIKHLVGIRKARRRPDHGRLRHRRGDEPENGDGIARLVVGNPHKVELLGWARHDQPLLRLRPV